MEIALRDWKDIFGNDAADHEDPDVLEKYFYEQPAFADFENPRAPFGVVVARKGVGKSALLRYIENTKRKLPSPPYVVALKGHDFAGPDFLPGSTARERVAEWQVRICTRLCAEVGRTIHAAFNDAAITVVEHAELTGFRGRSMVGTIFDRLASSSLPLQQKKPELVNAMEALRRVQETRSGAALWMLVDDLDATFVRTRDEALRLSSFLVACHHLTTVIPELVVRISLRKDVWAIIRPMDEALDKFDQYLLDIQWSRNGTKSILAKRIRTAIALKRQREAEESAQMPEGVVDFPPQGYQPLPPIRNHADEVAYINLVFDADFRAPHGHRKASVVAAASEAHHLVHVLSQGRPRWVMQLCKEAAKEALAVGSSRIKQGHVRQVLERYGNQRISDLVNEHRHQCPQIESLLFAFARQKVRWTTGELLAFLEDIRRKVSVCIDEDGVASALPIAHFLFRVGFVSAVDKGHRRVRFFRYEERGHLLTSVASLDEGMCWDIHPAFRGVLFMGESAAGLK